MIPIRRPIWSLPINRYSVKKLREAGYEYLEDLLISQSTRELKELYSKIGMTLDLSTFVNQPIVETSLELLKVEMTENGHVVTFSRAIDDLLGGGFPSSRITELVGAPGSGKTQICFQLCVSVQIPAFLGHLSGSAVYIGTNNNFSEKRIREIHAAVIEHCLTTTNNATMSEENHSSLRKFVATDPLVGIQKYSIGTVHELRASIYVIEKLLKESKNVVITNELTTCILDNETKEIIPSLGESFAHVIHNRVFLGRQESTKIHTAVLQKSSEYPPGSAYFQIRHEGIRDVPVS